MLPELKNSKLASEINPYSRSIDKTGLIFATITGLPISHFVRQKEPGKLDFHPTAALFGSKTHLQMERFADRTVKGEVDDADHYQVLEAMTEDLKRRTGQSNNPDSALLTLQHLEWLLSLNSSSKLNQLGEKLLIVGSDVAAAFQPEPQLVLISPLHNLVQFNQGLNPSCQRSLIRISVEQNEQKSTQPNQEYLMTVLVPIKCQLGNLGAHIRLNDEWQAIASSGYPFTRKKEIVGLRQAKLPRNFGGQKHRPTRGPGRYNH